MKLKIQKLDPTSTPIESYQPISTFIHSNSDLDGWNPESLNKCLVCPIWDGEYLAGVVWFNWLHGDKVLEAHGVFAKQYHRYWASRRLLNQLVNTAVATQCNYIVAQCPTPKLRKFWTQMGWTILGDLAAISIERNEDGSNR